MAKTMVKPTVVLDLPDLCCPQPILKAKRALKSMSSGEVLEVRSSDKHSIPDLEAFCTQTGHVWLGALTVDETSATPFHSQIQKA